MAIEELFGPDCDSSMPRRFQFEEEELEFKPSQWCGDEWSVFVTETNQVRFLISVCGFDSSQ